MSKEYQYPIEFEALWTGIAKRETRKAVAYKIYLRTRSKYETHDCPHCGTKELLCGFNGVGCEKEKVTA